MLIKRNVANFKFNDLLPLRQLAGDIEEEEAASPPLSTAHPLNPEMPISSVLLPPQKHGNPCFDAEKQDSQFSFKQKNVLTHEHPLDFDEDFRPNDQPNFPQTPQKLIKFERTSFRKKLYDKAETERSPARNKNAIGKLINPKKMNEIVNQTCLEASRTEQLANIPIKKPNCANNNSRFYDTLNKIKSLRIPPSHKEETKHEHGVQVNQRYSRAAKEEVQSSEQHIGSTDTSAEQAYPIKQSIISNIMRQVETASLSPTRETRKLIPLEEEDSQTHSILFHLSTERKPKEQSEELLDSKAKSFLVRSTNKRFKKAERHAETVCISYKTSVLELKELCSRYDESMRLRVKIPELFSRALFEEDDEQEELFAKATQILKELEVYSKQMMTIRRYSNCVVVLVEDLAIISYFSSHIYFGSWQNGCKNGLGFEWSPGKFVYYGQFGNNKREGYGVLKDNKGVLLGQWKDNTFLDPRSTRFL